MNAVSLSPTLMDRLEVAWTLHGAQVLKPGSSHIQPLSCTSCESRSYLPFPALSLSLWVSLLGWLAKDTGLPEMTLGQAIGGNPKTQATQMATSMPAGTPRG